MTASSAGISLRGSLKSSIVVAFISGVTGWVALIQEVVNRARRMLGVCSLCVGFWR